MAIFREPSSFEDELDSALDMIESNPEKYRKPEIQQLLQELLKQEMQMRRRKDEIRREKQRLRTPRYDEARPVRGRA